jgi:outer membrane protein TolC
MIKNASVLFFYMLIFSILSGCALYGPIYKKPKVSQPDKWTSKDSLSTKTNMNLPTLPWWQQFHDKQLITLIDKAVQNNNIQVAVGHVLEAQGELLQVQYSLCECTVTGLCKYKS